LKDDFLKLRDKMQAADGVIIATPVYVNDVSGIVKTWMDRMAFVCHRPEFAGKQAYLIATVGLGSSSHALKTLYMALSTWGFSIMGQSGFKMGALMEKERAKSQFQVQTQKIAKEFLMAINRRNLINPSFISLMTFRIQQAFWSRNPQPGSVDYEFWKNQGWTHPQRDYYIPQSASRIKVNFARMVGAILAPFVT
jgi:multimeric flavodoxin WrbA